MYFLCSLYVILDATPEKDVSSGLCSIFHSTVFVIILGFWDSDIALVF